MHGHISGQALRTVSYNPQSCITGSAGQFICPASFVDVLESTMQQEDELFGLAIRVETDNGQPAGLPIINDTASAAIVAENQATTDGYVPFAQIAFGQCPMWRSKVCVAPLELIQDSAFPFETVLAKVFGARFARGMGAAFVNTLLSQATVGLTSTLPSAITTDELFDFMGSVDAAYLQNAASLLISRAQKIGAFLRGFRLESTKNSAGNMAYDRERVITTLAGHVPENIDNPTCTKSNGGLGATDGGPSTKPPYSQPTANKGAPGATGATGAFLPRRAGGTTNRQLQAALIHCRNRGFAEVADIAQGLKVSPTVAKKLFAAMDAQLGALIPGTERRKFRKGAG